MIEELQKDGTDFLDLRIVRHRSGKNIIIDFVYKIWSHEAIIFNL